MNSHLDTGTLRRLLDEPDAVDVQDRAHVASCEQCTDEMNRLKADARFVDQALSFQTPVSMERAYARVSARVSEKQRRSYKGFARVAGLAAAAVFVAALFLTPLGGYARSLLTIFEPQQFQPVEISTAQVHQFKLLPQADEIGTQRLVSPERRVKYASIAQAAKHLPFKPQVPQTLPHGFSAAAAYYVHSPSDWTFTFNAAKARAYAARTHRTLPPMPRNLDGTTIRAHIGAFFEARYGTQESALEVVQVPPPKISSSGATLAQLEAYLLKMPGFSPQLVQQLQAIAAQGNTLPVPVQIGKQHAKTVTINGAQGLAVGDNTGVGAGVMWMQDGLLHFVAGGVTMDDALAVANGLK